MLTVEKARIQEKSLVLNAYSRKEKRLQVSDLTFYLKIVKEEQIKPKSNRKKK